MSRKFFRIYIQPALLLICALLPWYLLYKYALEQFIKLEFPHLNKVFWPNAILLYFIFVFIERWRDRVPDEEKRDKQITTVVTIYGKGVILMNSVVFIVVLILVSFFLLRA